MRGEAESPESEHSKLVAEAGNWEALSPQAMAKGAG